MKNWREKGSGENKLGNGDEFPDFADLFFFWHKKC